MGIFDKISHTMSDLIDGTVNKAGKFYIPCPQGGHNRSISERKRIAKAMSTQTARGVGLKYRYRYLEALEIDIKKFDNDAIQLGLAGRAFVDGDINKRHVCNSQ